MIINMKEHWRYSAAPSDDFDEIKTSDESILELSTVERGSPGRWEMVLAALKGQIKIALAVAGITVLFYLSLAAVANIQTRSALRFKEDGTFQITVFADLHFGENAWEPWGPEQDIKSLAVMNTVLAAEMSQVVVLNGDLITGENTFTSNNTEYLDKIVEPIVQRNLPFASTYGNHDSSVTLSREQLFERERKVAGSLTQQALRNDNAGVTNYYLPVYSHGGGKTPVLILWFFDSRGGHFFQRRDFQGRPVAQPNWVDESVVAWFRATKTALAKRHGIVIPSLAFVHIPTNASAALQSEIGVDAHRQPGINDDYVLSPQAKGYCADGISNGSCSYGGQDGPFLEAINSTPGLMAVFSGHDHGNSWCYKWNQAVPGLNSKGNGVNLCFGQHSGYGGYGNWTRGARQIQVHEVELRDHIIHTWIRLESGEVVGRVALNSTYGTDVYPGTPNTHSG